MIFLITALLFVALTGIFFIKDDIKKIYCLSISYFIVISLFCFILSKNSFYISKIFEILIYFSAIFIAKAIILQKICEKE